MRGFASNLIEGRSPTNRRIIAGRAEPFRTSSGKAAARLVKAAPFVCGKLTPTQHGGSFLTDELLKWRPGIPILEKTVYFISHSLAAMARPTYARLHGSAHVSASRGV